MTLTEIFRLSFLWIICKMSAGCSMWRKTSIMSQLSQTDSESRSKMRHEDQGKQRKVRGTDFWRHTCLYELCKVMFLSSGTQVWGHGRTPPRIQIRSDPVQSSPVQREKLLLHESLQKTKNKKHLNASQAVKTKMICGCGLFACDVDMMFSSYRTMTAIFCFPPSASCFIDQTINLSLEKFISSSAN